MFWLTDRYGPRLTGSPEFEEAGDWAVKRLQNWGVTNVRKERFTYGRGWSLVKFHATMTEPRVMPIIGVPKAWTPGTNGTHDADVVRPEIANAEQAETWRGKLRGKIVLTQPAREVRMLDGDIVLRYADDPKWMEEALSMPPARGAGARRGGARRRGGRCGRSRGCGRGRGARRWRAAAAGRGRAADSMSTSSIARKACSRCSIAARTATWPPAAAICPGRRSTRTAARSSSSPAGRRRATRRRCCRR